MFSFLNIFRYNHPNLLSHQLQLINYKHKNHINYCIITDDLPCMKRKQNVDCVIKVKMCEVHVYFSSLATVFPWISFCIALQSDVCWWKTCLDAAQWILCIIAKLFSIYNLSLKNTIWISTNETIEFP